MNRIIIVLFLICPFAHSGEPGLSVHFESNGAGNLAYHLFCFTGKINCSKPVFEALWKQRLTWSPTDDKRVEYLSKFLDQISHQHPEQDMQAILLANSLPLSSPEELSERLKSILSAQEIKNYKTIFDGFWPRFKKWWEFQNVATLPKNSEQTFKPLLSFISQLKIFYQSDFNDTIHIHWIVRPYNPNFLPTRAQKINSSITAEIILEKQQLIDRLPVVVHEISHLLYSHSSPIAVTELKKNLSNQEAENLVDEVLATSFGNGKARSQLLSQSQFKSILQQPKSFYEDETIDKSAKNLLPKIDTWLKSNFKISSPQVAKDISSSVGSISGINHFLESFRSLVIVIESPEHLKYAEILKNYLKPSSLYLTYPVGSLKSFERLKNESNFQGVILLSYSKLDELKVWGDFLNNNPVEDIKRLSDSSPFLIFSAPTNSRPIYIIAVSNPEYFERAFETFKTLKSSFSGLHQP